MSHLKITARTFLIACVLSLIVFHSNAQQTDPLSPAIILETSNGGFIELLEVEGAEINDVLRVISDKTIFNIILDEDIRGKVNIFLTDVQVLDALRIILEKLDLAYSEESILIGETERDIIRVMSEEAFAQKYGYAFGHKIQTRIVPLVYIKAEDIAQILEQMKTSVGKIIFNEETNTFVLMDDPQTLSAMETVIKELDVPMETKEFNLINADAVEIAETIKGHLTKGVGRIEIDKAKNSIFVTDKLLKLSEIEKMIKGLDLIGKKIQIDVKVIQITLSDEHESGVDWEAIVSSYQSLGFKAFDTSSVLPKEKELLSLGTITKEDLIILTEALETVGEIKTVFVDQFITENSRTLDFLIPVEAVSSVEKPTQPELRLAKDDVKFYLIPRLEEEGVIAVDIRPSVYTIADQEAVSRRRQNILMRGVSKGADFLWSATRVIPGLGDDERVEEGDLIEEKFEESATINVENGSTIVIGGMIKEVLVKSLRKIPLLGDLPLLGFAFQTEGAQLRNTEVIAFLTIKAVAE